MNELVVPPAPLWYKSLAVACAPDNTLIYGSKNDIVVVRERGSEESAEIKIIQSAHSRYITSVSLNKKWKDPNAYVVSLGEEGVMRVWNVTDFEKKFTNKDHVEHKQPVVGAVFAGDDRIVSAASNGFVIVWNINTNESKPLKDLFNAKVTLTCLSSCPHAGWLLAFGLNNGCVVIADLRRNGQVLYKLRGHYQAVVSLSWCPAPINVFPRYTQNKVKNKTPESSSNDVTQSCSIVKEIKPNPWINLVHADDDEIPKEKAEPLVETVNDYLKECNDLKLKITASTSSTNDDDEQEESKLHDFDSENDHNCDEKDNLELCSRESSNDQNNTEDKPCEEKGIEETRESKIDNNRPLPKLFDPSGDFLDDSVFDESNVSEEIFEDKDTGDEKTKNNLSKLKEESSKKTDLSLHDEDSGIAIEEPATVKTEVIEEEPRTEYLLASSGKDRSVYIWRAGTDGRMQTFFQVQKRRKESRRDAKHANTWITLCWITPDTLLTTTMGGEVLAWPVPKPKDSARQYKVVHCGHTSTIFNMVSPAVYLTPYNWRDKVDRNFWTWGQDGRLINYHLNEGKELSSWCTVTASVTCFDSSSLDPNRLAIGIRDGTIKVWDLSLPHVTNMTMQKFQQKVTQKVSALAWHPIREVILGFGTEEGRVGFIDVVGKKNTLFPHYFHGQVHKVEWGPIKGNTSNLGLFAVAEGKLAIYDIQQPNSDPIHLELPGQLYVYRFAWKPDYSLLLLNGKDGSLVILSIDLTAITTIYINEKGLNSIVWHPDAFTNKTEISPRCNWFAASTGKGFLVYDSSTIIKNASATENLMENIVATCEGHLKPTLTLAWCPFDGNKIVSTAADGLAHVWDVVSKCAISTFVDPYCLHNPAIVWSPLNADLIILGGDKLIRIWSVSKNPPKTDEEFVTARKRLLAKTNKVAEPEKTDKNKIKVDIPQIKNYSKNSIIPSFFVSGEEYVTEQIANMRKLMMKEDKTVNDGDTKELDPLKIFADKDEVSELLTASYELKKREGRHKSCELISMWKGNVSEYIKDAINENRVTPTTITLAPMVSLKLWQDACESYAKTLSESADSSPLETATYFLACHKIEEAINCLCEGFMFKEALALAKHRLPESSDVIIKVVDKWAEHCINDGNFETAAYCYISTRQYENAAKALARRSNIEFLEFATELAEKEGNKGLYDSIKFKCNELKTRRQNEAELKDLPSRAEAVLSKVGDDNEGKSEIESEFEDKSEEVSSLNTDQNVDDLSTDNSNK